MQEVQLRMRLHVPVDMKAVKARNDGAVELSRRRRVERRALSRIDIDRVGQRSSRATASMALSPDPNRAIESRLRSSSP